MRLRGVDLQNGVELSSEIRIEVPRYGLTLSGEAPNPVLRLSEEDRAALDPWRRAAAKAAREVRCVCGGKLMEVEMGRETAVYCRDCRRRVRRLAVRETEERILFGLEFEAGEKS